MYKISKWINLATFFLATLTTFQVSAYDYPFLNPYVATVLGTPLEFSDELPEVTVKVDTIKIFQDRKVPEKLFNLDELYYSYIYQKGPAPLIFLIAGTGAGFNSGKMQLMQKAFHKAGYHVVSLSSSTHPNFVVSASSSGIPGNLTDDASDIYKVMQSIWEKHGNSIKVTDFYLTGYSLGAAQSAFVAKLDEQEKAFNFKKVLLINPPVSLYNSVNILDDLFEKNIPGGMDNFNQYYERVINAFADVYSNGTDVEFNNDFLYQAYKYKKPSSDESLEALIGFSFRISAMNMVLTTDILTKANYVVPKNLHIALHDDISDYSKVLNRLTFLDYFEGIMLPYAQSKNPAITKAELIEKLSLHSIDDYLRTSSKLGLIHNADDIILIQGEIDYLQEVFGARAKIFPHGGHCGNMAYPENIAAMVGFFETPSN